MALSTGLQAALWAFGGVLEKNRNLASQYGPNCRNGVFGSEQIYAGCRRGAYPLGNCGGDSDGDFYIDNLICFNFECNSNKSLFATCQTSS